MEAAGYGTRRVSLDAVVERYDAEEGPFEFSAVCASPVEHHHILADRSWNGSNRKPPFVSIESGGSS